MELSNQQLLYAKIQEQQLNEFLSKATIDKVQGGYDWVSALGSNIPVLGKAFSIGDAISAGVDVAQGQYKDAAFRGAMAGVGLIPFGGGAAKTALKIGGAAAKAVKATGQGAKGLTAVTKASKVAKSSKATAKQIEKGKQAKRIQDRMTTKRLEGRKGASTKPGGRRGLISRGGIKQGLAIGRGMYGNQPGGAGGGGMGSGRNTGVATSGRGNKYNYVKKNELQVEDMKKMLNVRYSIPGDQNPIKPKQKPNLMKLKSKINPRNVGSDGY